MTHSKNLFKFALFISLVGGLFVNQSKALALSEQEADEILTSCRDKLRSSWSRLKYNKNTFVMVQFRLLPDGGYSSPLIYTTSGDKGLDNCAINAVDGAVPFQRFQDAPLDVVARFDCSASGTGEGDVSVSLKGAPSASSLAERKIKVHDKYHQNAINIMLTRIKDGEKKLGKDSPKLWESLNFLANEYRQINDYENSQKTYERALAIQEKAGHKESDEAARSIVGLGEMYLQKGDRKKAEECFQQVVDMKDLPAGPALCSALENQAKLLYKDRKEAEGNKVYERIRQIKAGKGK